MNKENSCYTYFRIVGDFDPSEISRSLSLEPSRQTCVGDVRKDGTFYSFAFWEYGYCGEYDVFIEKQMMRTIKDLILKTQELKEIKQKYDVSFFLEVVPSMYVGNTNPCLAPNREVIEFCYHTETAIDIDLYLFNSEEID
jgi:hypothetical protein